ncbi:TPA: hypothetical protein DCX16_02810 [bacterium]|nr:hypothetical protein [bacterium]
MKVHIGIDFDNTIVTYDNVFYKYAFKLGLIPQDVKKNKQIIRDTIRLLPQGEEQWIKLQGLVYGLYMDEAELFDGVDRFLDTCKHKNIKVSIVSHKTIYPALGPRINLRDVAKKWLEDRGFFSRFGLLPEDAIFVGSIDEKLSEIVKRKCTHFIDDLLEILIYPGFPSNVQKILYSSSGDNVPSEIYIAENWDEIWRYFFG